MPLPYVPGSEMLPVTGSQRPRMNAQPFVNKALAKGALISGIADTVDNTLTGFYDNLQKTKAIKAAADAGTAMQQTRLRYAASLKDRQNDPDSWAPGWQEQAKAVQDEFMQSDAVKGLTALQRQAIANNFKVNTLDYATTLQEQANHKWIVATGDSIDNSVRLGLQTAPNEKSVEGVMAQYDLGVKNGLWTQETANTKKQLAWQNWAEMQVDAWNEKDPWKLKEMATNKTLPGQKWLNDQLTEKALRNSDTGIANAEGRNADKAGFKYDGGLIKTTKEVDDLENSKDPDVRISPVAARNLRRLVTEGAPADFDTHTNVKSSLSEIEGHTDAPGTAESMRAARDAIAGMQTGTLKTELTQMANRVDDLIKRHQSVGENAALSSAREDMNKVLNASDLGLPRMALSTGMVVPTHTGEVPFNKYLQESFPRSQDILSAYGGYFPKDIATSLASQYGTDAAGKAAARAYLISSLGERAESSRETEINDLNNKLRDFSKSIEGKVPVDEFEQKIKDKVNSLLGPVLDQHLQDKMSSKPKPVTVSPTAVPTITSKDAYDKLSSGDHYRDSKGQERVKP